MPVSSASRRRRHAGSAAGRDHGQHFGLGLAQAGEGGCSEAGDRKHGFGGFFMSDLFRRATRGGALNAVQLRRHTLAPSNGTFDAAEVEIGQAANVDGRHVVAIFVLGHAEHRRSAMRVKWWRMMRRLNVSVVITPSGVFSSRFERGKNHSR